MSSNKRHEYTYRVYVEDTDMFGVVYHARYLCFLERARTDYLRSQGISLFKLKQNGYSFVVANMTLNYLKPTYLDDELLVKTVMSKKRQHLAYFEQSIKNKKGEEVFDAMVKVVSLNNEGSLCYIDELLTMKGCENGQ
jgi:acyl-CoA thioester hydrolase